MAFHDFFIFIFYEINIVPIFNFILSPCNVWLKHFIFLIIDSRPVESLEELVLLDLLNSTSWSKPFVGISHQLSNELFDYWMDIFI